MTDVQEKCPRCGGDCTSSRFATITLEQGGHTETVRICDSCAYNISVFPGTQAFLSASNSLVLAWAALDHCSDWQLATRRLSEALWQIRFGSSKRPDYDWERLRVEVVTLLQRVATMARDPK